MLRLFPALIGLGLAALWVIGLSVDATTWLTWFDGIGATLAFASVGLIPERRSGLVAAFCLGGLAAGLLALWLVGVVRHATPWLTWWTLVAAGLTAASAFGAALQGAFDDLRTRDVI